jgi:thiol:disulfide interchange protein DsbD
VKEVGSMEKFMDKNLGISAHQYSNKVDFVQVVKIKSNAKTNVSGSVEFPNLAMIKNVYLLKLLTSISL